MRFSGLENIVMEKNLKMNNFIDLRSDTVTKPSQEMRKAMFDAEVGDDVYKEDPTVEELQKTAAEMLGKEAALFVPSGVMGNQICLNILTNPGDEVLCEKDAHIFQYESGSPAALSGIQISTIEGKNGILTAEQIEENIRPIEAYYMARTKVVEIENTHNRAGGVIQPIDSIQSIKEICDKHNLFFHLDGARLWNASVEMGIELSEYTKYFVSASCCLSKGLGAPIGSVIAGEKDFINQAFRLRKAWGGGMRQVGVLAAAGIYALEHNLPKLKEDHQKAKLLAEGISKTGAFEINLDLVHTNIVAFKPIYQKPVEIISKAKANGLLISDGKPGFIRAVTHLDISFENIENAVSIINKIVN